MKDIKVKEKYLELQTKLVQLVVLDMPNQATMLENNNGKLDENGTPKNPGIFIRSVLKNTKQKLQEAIDVLIYLEEQFNERE